MTDPRMHRCESCSASFQPTAAPFTCPDCGPRWGTLSVIYSAAELAGISRESLARDPEPSLWRYAALLPVEAPPADPYPLPGWTPLIPAPQLASELGIRQLFIKDDGRNPSASYKDRASAVGVACALEQGAEAIACASTGNAASSLSLFAARAGLPAYIFVPENAPAAKLTQLLVYGARVVRVAGTYDQAFDLCAAACERWGFYPRNTATNPVLSEGKKTGALELLEQRGWQVPDRVVVSVGDGCIIGGLHKGFSDAIAAGLVDHQPKLTGVQAEGSSALAQAFEAGAAKPEDGGPAETLADSISVGTPRDALKALRAARDSGGRLLSVTDQAILDAIPRLARATGVFGEPAGVTGLAGLYRLRDEGALAADETVVLIVTGNGLKDVAAGARAAGGPPSPVPPNLEAVADYLAL